MVTIVIPVSRDLFLLRLFASLEILECDPAQVNLLVYVDGDYNLFEKARNFTVNSKFADRLCVYREKGLPNVGSIRGRRKRISEIHNEIKGLLKKVDYVFIIEDDTIIPPNTLKTLLNDYSNYPYAGFISGVQVGRWGYAHIGAWNTDDIYEPSEITSVGIDKGVREIDAAGLYCCLIKFDNYYTHSFSPYESILGPDVDFGIKLRQSGLKNYINYDIKCSHLTKRGEITVQNSDIVQVQFKRADTHEGWVMEELAV